MMKVPYKDKTQARQALEEALRPAHKKRGRPALAWLKVVENDLTPILNLHLNTDTAANIINKLEDMTADRIMWHNRVKHHGDYSLIDDETIFIQYSESYKTIIQEVVILLVSNCIT